MGGQVELRYAASQLEGLAWSGVARRLEMQEFGFGPDALIHTRRAGERSVPRYGVHIQCPWRIERQGAVMVASSDIESSEGPSATSVWGSRDRKLGDLFREQFRAITRSDVSDFGDLTIAFSDGTALSVFVDRSDAGSECYRVIDVLGDHVVVYGGARVEVVPKG